MSSVDNGSEKEKDINAVFTFFGCNNINLSTFVVNNNQDIIIVQSDS